MNEWCFMLLSTVFQSYHSAHHSCLCWASSVIGLGKDVSFPRTLPQKTRGSSAAPIQDPWITSQTLYHTATQEHHQLYDILNFFSSIDITKASSCFPGQQLTAFPYKHHWNNNQRWARKKYVKIQIWTNETCSPLLKFPCVQPTELPSFGTLCPVKSWSTIKQRQTTAAFSKQTV